MKTSGKSWSRYIDKSIKAKKSGWRKSKETGERYYEDRPNHSDSDPKSKYAKGGKMWKMNDVSNAKYLGIIEFQDNDGEYHNFEVMETKDRLVFGGYTNTGFIESGYIEKDGFSTDETLQELLADLETYYNDGAEYTSMIVVNQRMAKGGAIYKGDKVKIKDSNSSMVVKNIAKGKKGYVEFSGDKGTYLKGDLDKMAKGGKTKKGKQDPPIVRGYFDDEPYEYAKGGEVGGIQIDNFKRNFMGTLSFDMKLQSMRKSQEFITYPVAEKTDYLTIQSSTRFGMIEMTTGRGLMSQSHLNGAYAYHFQTDKKVQFQLNETQLEELKQKLSKTAGANVGTRGIVSDNQYADKFADGGLLGGFTYSIGGL